ncbi:MAG: FtsB family cell division protein [Planctomycetota bacterium]
MRIFPRRIFVTPLLIVTIAAALFGFSVADRRSELYELRRRNARADRRLEALKEREEILTDERRRLLTEPSAIERAAREQFGLVASGEMVGSMDIEPFPREPDEPVRVESDGWDWLLGRGQYPWMLPLSTLLAGFVLLAPLEIIWRYRE